MKTKGFGSYCPMLDLSSKWNSALQNNTNLLRSVSFCHISISGTLTQNFVIIFFFLLRNCRHSSGLQREWRRPRSLRNLPVPDHKQHHGVQDHRPLDRQAALECMIVVLNCIQMCLILTVCLSFMEYMSDRWIFFLHVIKLSINASFNN